MSFKDLKIGEIKNAHITDDNHTSFVIHLENSEFGWDEEIVWIKTFDKVNEHENIKDKVYVWHWDGISMRVYMSLDELKVSTSWLKRLVDRANDRYRQRLENKLSRERREAELLDAARAIEF